MARALVESTPRIPIGSLRRAGLLKEGQPSEATLDLDSGAWSVTARRWARDEFEFSWCDKGERIQQYVKLVWSATRYGAAPYFHCPETGSRCRALFLKGAQLVSRQAAGLAYQSQLEGPVERLSARKDKLLSQLNGSADHGPARGASRRRLLGELDAIAALLADESLPASDAEDLLLRERERGRASRSRKRPRRSDSPMLTRVALQAGRAGEGRLTSRRISELLDRAIAIAPQPPPPSVGPALHRMPVERCPLLDVRLLRPRRGFARAHCLMWPVEERPQGLVLFARLELSDPDDERLILSGWEGARQITQNLKVARGRRRGDLFVICPIQGRRVVKLYYRDGCFASQQAQRLSRGGALRSSSL